MSDGERDDRALDRSVLALARGIADTINAGPVEDREVLREMAVNAVREQVQIVVEDRPRGEPGAAPFNPFAIGIPLILMGGLLVFLFPPVGLLMFAAAAAMMIWGVAGMLLTRGYTRG
jgi:hypothetical protein